MVSIAWSGARLWTSAIYGKSREFVLERKSWLEADPYVLQKGLHF
jgi:hypothetical protein